MANTETLPVPRRSRRAVAILLALLLLAVLGAAVWWFVRPLSTGITVQSALKAAVTGQQVAFSGEISPAAENRTVVLQAGGPKDWRTLTSGKTDAVGAWTLTVALSAAPEKVTHFRALVAKSGRHKQATSNVVEVRTLTGSTVTLRGPKAVPLTRRLLLSGSVLPAKSGRTVTVEQSGDGKQWVAAAITTKTLATGAYSLSFPVTTAGTLQFRTVVAADDNYGGAASRAVPIVIEDYKAAGAYYLKIVGPSNAASRAFDKVVTQDISLAKLKAAAGTYSKALQLFATQLDTFQAWPIAVQPPVEDLIKQIGAEYDAVNQMAAAKTMDAFYRANQRWVNLPDSGAATVIRQKLGLPARR